MQVKKTVKTAKGKGKGGTSMIKIKVNGKTITKKISHGKPSVVKVKLGGKSRSIISRISSFKPKSLITIGGKRKYKKHSGGKSRKSYRKVKSGGRKKSKKSYNKKGGSKSLKSKKTHRK